MLDATLIGAISGAIVVVTGALAKWVIDLRKERQSSSIQSNEQALLFYKSLVETLQKQVQDITIQVDELEEEHIKTREENATLRAKLSYLEKNQS